MKQKTIVLTGIAVWYAAVLVGLPLMARADEPAILPAVPLPTTAPVLLTEVQIGTTASGAEEFIELYNASDQAIDFGARGWQLQIGNAASVDWQSPYRTIPLSGSLEPGGYYVVASKYTVGQTASQYLADTAKIWFSAGISAEAAHLRLVYTVNQTLDGVCTPALAVADQLEWSIADAAGEPLHASVDGRSPFVTPAAAGLPPDTGLQRYRTPSGSYVDTNTDKTDLALAAATPGMPNSVITEAAPATSAAIMPDECQTALPPDTGLPTAPPADNPPDSPSAPSLPVADIDLLAPQISELMPNPAAPLVDADDEFIELYNPNDVAFDLTGFALETGLTAKHTYRFATTVTIPPQGFAVFYAKDTGLVLSNAGSQARLLDPFGAGIAQSDAYGAAAAGQAWILAEGRWQWTTTPTPVGANIISSPSLPVPSVATAKTSTVSAKKTTPVVAKKTTAVKAAKITKPVKAVRPKTTTASNPPKTLAAATAEPKNNPLHPGVLAVAAVLALLYGAYEYRHDVANYIRKFRDNRAARRTTGQTTARR